MNDDTDLLRRYVEEGTEDAFTELVHRHVNLVYSAALRQLNGDGHLATDATQLVFMDLARKAPALIGHRVLAGWLFTSTRYAAAKLVRTERRRHAREREAHLMHEMNDPSAGATLEWQRVRPVLDDVLAELNEPDREAILLRFFEGRDYAGVGSRLRLSDNTARMRVERALEKLRGLLERRGIDSTTTALAVALAQQGVMAAPAGLAPLVASAAYAGGAAALGTSAGAFATFMSVNKLQLGLAGVMAMSGATGYLVQAESTAALRREVVALRSEGARVAESRAENLRLAGLALETDQLRRDAAATASLRDQAVALEAQLQAINARTLASKPAASPPVVTVNGPVFEIGRIDVTPKPKFQARPEYPASLRSSGTPGEVVVDFVVDTSGDVKNAFALRSSDSGFEEAAVTAVSKWKFAPGQVEGEAVNTHLQVPIVFTLGNPSRTDATSAGANGQGSATVRQQSFWF